MSQTALERRDFPVPMRWLHAGRRSLSTNHIHQPADRPLTRSERPPKCLLRSPTLASRADIQLASAGVRPSSRFGANINSP